MMCVGKVEVARVVRMVEHRVGGLEGMISGVSLNVNTKELDERMYNSSLSSVKRMTKGD